MRAVSIAGEVLSELAKLGEADQRLVEQKSNEFLGIIKVPAAAVSSDFTRLS